MTLWDGTVEQDPLHASSDYFNDGATLDPQWEEWDVGGHITVSQADGAVKLSQPTSAGDDYGGIITPAPTDTQWCVTARMRLSSRFNPLNPCVGSLIIGEDLAAVGGNPSTGSFANSQILHSSAGVQWEGTIYSNYTTFADSFGSDPTPASHVCYLRWYVDLDAGVAGEITPLVSADGRTWIHYPSKALSGSAISAIDSIGIASANLTGQDMRLSCDLFRIDLTSDPRFPIGGHPSVLV